MFRGRNHLDYSLPMTTRQDHAAASTPSAASPAAASQPSADQLATKAQAWSALFSEPMSELVKRYTSSVFFDKRLWQADIAGSLAHAEMLAAQGIISSQDLHEINRGMGQIAQEIESGQLLPVLPGWEGPPTEIGAVYPSRRGLSPKVRVCIDFLSERLAHLSGDSAGSLTSSPA